MQSDAPTRETLASDVLARCHLSGVFTLRSGRTSGHYFDKYQFESDPALLAALAAQMVLLIPDDVDLLAGLEMGGIAMVTALSAAAAIPAVFVRKAAKPYGTNRLAEGPAVNERRLLIVDDVVTSGGQIAASGAALRGLGAVIDSAVCVVDREEGGSETLAGVGITLYSLFTASDLKADEV